MCTFLLTKPRESIAQLRATTAFRLRVLAWAIIGSHALKVIMTMLTASRGRRRRLSVMVGLAIIAIACGSSSPTSPSVNVPYSQTDLRLGTGAEAVSGKRLLVNYTGWLYDAGRPDQKGQPFDSNAGKGAFPFVLGASDVIQGWDQGVARMRVGGVRRLVIPPSLGYGSAGRPPIPGNATLVFEVELLDVQ
jgi:FKBP-type peptidyl-prolyl cis-trans isomerase FkpA